MQFRKKPVVIEAWQLPIGVTEQAVLDAPSWVRTLKFFETGGGDNNQPFRTVAVIDTLEGVMRAEPLDWIIRGIKGEMYPCKPDIFAATYETAAAPAAPSPTVPALPAPVDFSDVPQIAHVWGYTVDQMQERDAMWLARLDAAAPAAQPAASGVDALYVATAMKLAEQMRYGGAARERLRTHLSTALKESK